MSVPKLFVIISNTEGDNFSNAMAQQVNGEPEILYTKAGKYHKHSIVGDMMGSEDTKADLEVFLR